LSPDAFSEASLTQKCDVGPRSGAYSAPGPLAGLRARERRGEGREEGRGWKKKGGRGGEGRGRCVPASTPTSQW